MILIPVTIKNNPTNTPILNPGDDLKNILDIKYINIIFNETIIATNVTSGDNFIECININENAYPINPKKINSNNIFVLNSVGGLHSLS